MTAYPVDPPFAEIKDVLSIIHAGEIAAKKAEFVHDLLVIQGYAQSRIIGADHIASAQALDDEDPITLLEKVVNTDVISTQTFKDGLIDVLSVVDWATVLQWSVKILVANLLA